MSVDVMHDGGLVGLEDLAVRWRAPAGVTRQTRRRWMLRRIDELGLKPVLRAGRDLRFRFTDVLRMEERRSAV